MIRLSLEIPTAALKIITPLTDFDFVLAHKVLEDQAYAHFFAKRERMRMLVLDNSTHELGHPLPVKDLKKAAAMCRANFVVAPDKLGEPEKNLQWFEETYNELHHEHRIAVTLAGHTKAERCDFINLVKYRTEMLCFPFREPRLQWFYECQDLLHWCPNIHLFGVSELPELAEWVEISKRNPHIFFSVDTTKPVKFGLRKLFIGDQITLRGSTYDAASGGNTHAKELLDVANIDAEQMNFIKTNIQMLRKVCIGKENPR